MNNQFKKTGKDYNGSLPVFCLYACSNKNKIKTYPAIPKQKPLISLKTSQLNHNLANGIVVFSSGCFRR